MDDSDEVFKALADSNRRMMLDLLRADPGMTVGEIGQHFAFSRYATMKHIRVLEDADLVIAHRKGRRKLLYLNAAAIQTIHDRWLSRFSSLWAGGLTALKYTLEREENSMGKDTLDHVFVLYIKTTPERLWQALTGPDMTPMYFHGTKVRSDFEVGSTIEYMLTREGETYPVVVGEILEADPGKKLVHSFAFSRLEDAPTRVTYTIDPMGEVVRLTVLHEGFEGETETFADTKDGWPPILSGLKTLMETGEPLDIPE